MRRQRQRFIPIFLIALVVQILAPIAASWAAAIAASDPLGAAAICFNHPEPASGDQGTDRHAADGGLCSMCCSAPAGSAFDRPNAASLVILYREPAPVFWRDDAMAFVRDRAGSTCQARAPPQLA